MAEPSPQVFKDITPEQYRELTLRAHSAGIEITGNSGRTSRMGVEIELTYSVEDQELTLTCLHAPFFLSTEDVNARLRAVVNESLKSILRS